MSSSTSYTPTSLQVTINETSSTIPALSASGSIPNGAAAGTAVGPVSSSLPSPTLSMSTYGGLALTAAGTGVTVGVRAPDIMYRRAITARLMATVSQGVLAASAPAVQLSIDVTFPVVEVGSPTLTLSSSAGTTLSMAEWNGTQVALSTISVTSGAAAGTIRYQVVTDGAACECVAASPTTATLQAVLFTDSVAKPTHTFRVRAVDSAGAYGYLDITLNITAWALSSIPNLYDFDPANLVGTAPITGLDVKQGATSFRMVVPAGAPALSTTSVSCPDGVAKLAVVHSQSSNPQLACGPGYAGSSTTLGAAFSQTGIAGAVGTAIVLFNMTTAASYRNLIAFFNSAYPGGWTATTAQGLSVGMNSSGASFANGWPDGGVRPASASIGALSPGWQVLTVKATGNTVVCEQQNFPALVPMTDPNSVSPHTNDGTTQPKTNTMTVDTVAIGTGLDFGSGSFSWMRMFAAPRNLLRHELEAIYAYITRHYPLTTPAVPLPRKTVANMPPAYQSDWPSYYNLGDWVPETYDQSSALMSLNSEIGVYVTEQSPNISATFPHRNAYYDASTGDICLPVRALTAAQKTYVTGYSGNLPLAKTAYGYRSTGIRTDERFHQYLGYFEAQVKIEAFTSLWPAAWLFPSIAVGGPQEMDFFETGGQTPDYPYLTLHFDGGGQEYLKLPTEDFSVNYVWFGVDWIDNFDGTVSFQRYVNRRKMGPPTIVAYSQATKAMGFLLDNTLGGQEGTPDSYTIAALPNIFRVKNLRSFYAYTDKGQPPLITHRATAFGTRGNANTLTCIPASWDWGGTQTYQWFSYSPAAGLTALAGQTAATLTDTTALQGLTVFCQNTNTNSYWPLNPTRSGAFFDPATTPAMSLSATSFTSGQATGTVLAAITGMSLGAAVSITGSDTTGRFTVGPDGTELLAGANFAALAAGSYNVLLTQTPRFGGPVNNQTIAITVTSAGAGTAWGGTWAANANYTRTNTNLTATQSLGFDGLASVQGTTSYLANATADHQFTVTLTVDPASNQTSIGLADSGYTANQALGGDAHSIGVSHDGQIVYNGFVNGANLGTLAVNDVITIRLKNGVFYAKKNAGAWMGTSTTADPTAGTGGVTVSFLSGAVLPTAAAYKNGTQFVAAF